MHRNRPSGGVARFAGSLAVALAAPFPLGVDAQAGPPAVAVGTVDTVFIRDAAGGAAAAGAATLADLLAGRLPWLVVTRSSGIAGEAATFSLPEPGWGAARVAVYVDGVRLDDVPLALLGDRVIDPFLEIDPELVERVELVRGPVAAGRYGPEAAGGVLLVTTRALAGGSGLRQDVSATLGMVSPPDFEPTWHTCTGTEPLAECADAAVGDVVSADGLGQSGIADTRPLQKLKWLVGYAGGAVAVQGAVAGARRQGAFAGEGFERLAVQLSGSVEPWPGLRISAAGARMGGDVSVDRDLGWDLFCHTIVWPYAEYGPCLTRYEPLPEGDGPTRGYERAATRASATVSHSPVPWLEHRLTATHRTLEDDAWYRPPVLDSAFVNGSDRRAEQYSRSWEYQVTGGVRFGGARQWSLGTEAAAWQEHRARAVRHDDWQFAPSSGDTLRSVSEEWTREKRSRVRVAGELGWKDRGFLRGALVHQSDGLPLRSFRDSTDHHVLPSASAEYRWPAVRVHAAWGRSRTNPFFDTGWDPSTGVPLSGLFTTLEGGAAATLAGGRARIGLTGSRTDAIVEYRGLPTYDARTTAVEVRLDGTFLKTAAYAWDVGASLLAMNGRVAQKAGRIFVDSMGGIWVATIGGERPGSFLSRVVVDIDTVAGVAELSDFQAVGHVTPDLEGAFRTAFTAGPLRLDASLHLRHGNTVMNWAEYRRDLAGTSRAANDPTVSATERIRRFGPFVAPDGARGDGPLRDMYLVDGSFVRLRLLALTLTLPDRLAGVALPAGEMTLAGRDLWTIAGYAGPDPESHPLAPPIPRVLAFRLSLGL